jgi:acetyl esterase/lipase
MMDMGMLTNGHMRCIVAGLLMALFTGMAPGAGEPLEEPLWPGGVRDKAIVHSVDEKMVISFDEKTGRTKREASFVSVPTLTFFPAPKAKATRALALVFPGGGYKKLALGKEGWDVAERLNEMGIAAVVVKYRTVEVADLDAKIPDAVWAAQFPSILADGKQAVRVVRSRAAELGVDPNKIGIVGFSAGAHLAANVALQADAGNKNASDVTGRMSCRPDFVGAIYAGLDPAMQGRIRAGLPPFFIAVAANDSKVQPASCIAMFQALRKVGVPAELHIFQSGEHGFGLGRAEGTSSTWPTLFDAWLKENGFVGTLSTQTSVSR